MSQYYEPKKKRCKRCKAEELEVLALARVAKQCYLRNAANTVCHRSAPHPPEECSPHFDMELGCEACFTDFDPKKYWFTGYDHERLAQALVSRRRVETLEKAKEYLHTGKWLLGDVR